MIIVMKTGPASKIVELLLYTRKASNTSLGSFGLRERLLFCLRESPQPPRELMEALCMTKSNLALLAGKCIAEGLISKEKHAGDRRALSYSLTEKGEAEIDKLLGEIERKFATVLTDEEQKLKAEEELDSVIELLSYL